MNSRLDLLTDYPFQRLAALIKGVEAPEDTVIMSIGEPQMRPPAFVAEILAREAAHWNKYPPIAGTPELRAAITVWLTRRFGLPVGAVDLDRHLQPLSGSREGLYLIAQLVCDADAAAAGKATPVVLLPNPFYQIYAGAALMAGAEPVFVPATAETGFLPDFAALPRETLDRAVLAYLCNPGNPQGAVADAAQLGAMIRLARQHGFVLAVDECYAEIYDQTPPPGALAVALELDGSFDGVVVLHSLSKRSSAPGLRSGFAAGDPALMAGLGKLRAYAGGAIPAPIQAASAALWRDDAHVVANRAAYRAKFDVASRLFGHRPGFVRPAGGFFLWLQVGDGEAFTRTLWQRAGIKLLPGAYLARPGADGVNPGAPYVRIALVHDLPVLEPALTALAGVLAEVG